MLTRPLTMTVIMIDGVSLLLCLLCFTVLSISLVKDPAEELAPPLCFCLWLLFSTNMYLATREVSQARAMNRIGLFGAWAADGWNVVDVGAVCGIFLFLQALVAGEPLRNKYYFQNISVLTALCLWAKVLGFLKVLSVKFATFILCLGQIFSEMASFMIVLLVVLLMFSHQFFLILHTRDDNDGPFKDFGESMLTTFNMLIGDFERETFSTDGSVVLFVVYVLLVDVVLLNVLIAVVSDSYEKGLASACKIFMRARLELVAEHDALFSSISETWGASNRYLTILLKPLELQLRVRSLGIDDGQSAQHKWAGRSGNAERRMSEMTKSLGDYVMASEKRTEKAIAASEARIIEALARTGRGEAAGGWWAGSGAPSPSEYSATGTYQYSPLRSNASVRGGYRGFPVAAPLPTNSSLLL
mmetsp:Transcript_4460/g.9508  ORF Transcript_4460/g.9508 Transcript_4460/m.9508 type:complete len:415 (+) Transcript_4460:18-1262(+)